MVNGNYTREKIFRIIDITEEELDEFSKAKEYGVQR